jgi:HK97 family phage prohead protease
MDRTNLIERRFEFQTRALPIEGEDREELWVEGYAARFNSPTVLFEVDGIEYKEQIASDAFTDCKMDDVIFNYNHSGRVMARTRNKTLQLAVDDGGLFIRARLDGTEEGRSLYRDIQNGYIDRMSFRFTIGQEAYDYQNRTWTVLRVKRLYDVSAVDIPAYDDTSIEARKAAAEADARERQRKAEAELMRQKLIIKLKLEELTNEEKTA